MFQYHKLGDTDTAITEFQDLLQLKFTGNLANFWHEWEYCMLGLRKDPPEDILEQLLLF